VPNVTTTETVEHMEKVTGELIRGEAAHLRGVDIGQARAGEIAVDIGKIVEALSALRERLDFNDEPARFDTLLAVPPISSRQRK
jgi:hypothetical protein